MPEHSTELPSGYHIARYQVRRRLGAGGFARVYCAWDPDLEIDVAIKVPKPELADDSEALERFRREATTAARLRHPNVVTVLTVGRLEEPFDGAPAGAPYLVMDYLPESLSGRLATTPVLPEPEWLRIGEEVARGLAYAHAQGVVHRDVKPDNILFGRHGEAVVTDFGIARAVSERLAPTSRSIVVGTPEYFSPEQARGLPLDGRTDIYALGVTLYRMATGSLPFLGDDWYAIMRQHVEDAPTPPRELNPTISRDAEQVILRCLAKSADDRFQTAAELAASLAAAAHPIHAGGMLPSEGATVDLSSVRASAARSRARRRIAIAGGVILASAGLIAAAVALTHRPFARLATPSAATPSSLATTPLQTRDTSLALPSESSSTATLPLPSSAPLIVVARASLDVSAPPGALIMVDNRYVGSGHWSADTLPAGRHDITAELATAPGCPSGRDSKSVNLARGDHRKLQLRPTPCGSIALDDVRPLPAHYTLSREGGGFHADGPVSATSLVVPEGAYRLIVEARDCAKYDDSLHVQAASTPIRPRVRLYCP